ncbi:hypothetical protein GCM10009616_18420 [Microlunatus lacustris]
MSTLAPEHPLLTDVELAERWQLSRGTLANIRSRGDGVPYVKVGGRVRYALADVLAYEAARRVQTSGR